MNRVIIFVIINVVFLTLTMVISSCTGSKNETIKTPPKIVQVSILENFVKSKSEIKSFDDLSKHLNDYKSIWKAMGINWDYTNDVVLNFRKWSKSGYLKTAKEDLVLQVINDLPKEGDLRGIVYDLWIENKKKK